MSKIFSVSNSEELMNALASATGGDTIELAGGDYGDLRLLGSVTNVAFDSAVSIVSADPQNKAVISGLDLRDASNIKFDSLIFDYEFSDGDPGWIQPFAVRDSDNITFSNSLFLGDVASGISEVYDGFGYGHGLKISNSENITIEKNYFETAGKGLILDSINGLNAVGNEITDMREDGMNLIQVENAVVENNYIHDFRTHPEDPGHRDMIQLWVLPTHDAPGKNITISGNVLDIGEGVFTQGIFMRNGAAEVNPEDTSMYWQNITIENNVIYNNHGHGITVGETVNLSVSNNTIIQVDDAWGEDGANMAPRINIAENSENVLVSDNIASGITGYANQDTWDVTSNALISKEDYIDNFIASSIGSEGGTHGFRLLPDTQADQLGAGSEHVQFPDAPEALTPFFQVHSDESSSHDLIFDASLTVGPLGLVSEDDAEFLWTFKDGSTATGRVVKHAFEAPGYHDVTLTVVTKDGTTAQASYTAGISGDRLVQFDAQSGQFESVAYGEETPLGSIEGNVTKTAGGSALKLGGEGIKASIPKSELAGYFGTDAFEMSLSLKADSAGSWGEISYFFENFRTFVDQSGNYGVTFFLDNGSRVDVVSQGVDLRDGNVHDITVRFDGASGFAEIAIDGKVVAGEKVPGSLGDGGRDFMFGNPWGNQKFTGELSAFTLSAESFDFPIYDGEAVPVSSTETTVSEGDTITDTPDDVVTETPPEEDHIEESGETVAPDLTEPEDPTPAPEEDSGALQPLLLDGYDLDIAGITTSDTERLHDNAYVIETQTGSAVVMDGKKDYVSLGRLEEFETSEEVAFTVDFVNKNTDGARDILVWNHMKLGLTLENDGLRVHAGNAESHFSKGFLVEGLGLNDGGRHTATVMVDAGQDRLQVVVDDVLVLDERDTDFDFVGAGGHEWGWTLGTPWNRWFEGEVHDFQVSDNFEFLDVTSDDGMPLA